MHQTLASAVRPLFNFFVLSNTCYKFCARWGASGNVVFESVHRNEFIYSVAIKILHPC